MTEPASDGPADTRGSRTVAWRRFGVMAAVVSVASLIVLASGLGRPSGATYELVLAPGTAVTVDPAIFEGVPHRRVDDVIWLELERGDTLVVRNADDQDHQVWALSVRPGETLRHTFTEYGTFSGDCTFDMTVFIEVR